MIHQYIERETGRVRTEKLFGDRIIQFLYSTARENAATFYKAATSARTSALLGYLNYGLPYGSAITGGDRIVRELGIDLTECLDPPRALDSPRKIFERKIRYRERRPMDDSDAVVVSPADARMLIGSFQEASHLFLKEKFFSFDELFRPDPGMGGKKRWREVFAGGDFAVFRLTPEKYHYNHVPVTGRVIDIYEISGAYHSCNPAATVRVVTPLSTNKRVVTIIDTEIDGGSRVGRVAMIEVAALMIGEIVQCYSETGYDSPRDIRPGMVLYKGRPKSLYRPGSSVDVLVFEKNRVDFCGDIVANLYRNDAESRFSKGFGRPLIETEVTVRSTIAIRNKIV